MEKEAASIFEYLFSKRIPENVAQLYERGLQLKNIPMDETDGKLWSRISQRPMLIGLVDGYYALAKPKSGIRKRVQLLSAIAEASTDYTDSFLPQDRSIFYLIKIGLVGCRGVTAFVLGFFYCKIFS